MKTLATVASTLALAFGLAGAADAAVRVGVLHCHAAKKVGAIIGSTEEARCVFKNYNGHREHYAARFDRAGVDVGVTAQSDLVWVVYAPTSLHHHALAGDYVGASAEVTIGIGAGANVLVGGSSQTISLQPVSLKAQTGLAVGAGFGRLQLR
jgi:hypothetical protein